MLVKVLIAIVLSLVVHLLALYYFNDKVKLEEPKVNSSSKVEPIGYQKIKYVKLVEPKVQKKIQAKAKPLVKKKKLIKKENPRQKYIKVPEKKPTKKIIKRAKVVPVPIVKSIPKPIEKQIKPKIKQATQKEIFEKQKKEDLKEIQKLDDRTKSFLKLYGEEYFTFSKETKKYLNDNINNIGFITESYLRQNTTKEMKMAKRRRLKGMNIVQFFFYPNGDISDLKVTHTSGYSVLDKVTERTIKIAYKDYPRPKEKTKVKIYVYYQL